MVYRQNLPIHIKFQQQEIKKKILYANVQKNNRFAWISTLIDIENKPDKIQLIYSNRIGRVMTSFIRKADH